MLLDALSDQLLAFCRNQSSDPGAGISALSVMPGHAGFTYGFCLDYAAEGQRRHEAFVLRLAPPGVRYEGPADMLHQARILRALAETDVPVPPVRWAGDDPRWFGRPYYVMECLPGQTLRLEAGQPLPPSDARTLEVMASQAVAALAALHRLDWTTTVPEWGPPRSPAEDVTRWDRFWERSAEPELVRLGPVIRRQLIERLPAAPRLGIFHGDFQWTNLLYQDERLTAVLDWELADVGAVLNDLGWLMVFSDPLSWAPHTAVLPPVPAPEVIYDLYRRAWGADPGDVAWYRALAGYKFAIIAGFNLMLHRRGKRVDPHYELLAPSIPILMERALEVLSGASG